MSDDETPLDDALAAIERQAMDDENALMAEVSRELAAAERQIRAEEAEALEEMRAELTGAFNGMLVGIAVTMVGMSLVFFAAMLRWYW